MNGDFSDQARLLEGIRDRINRIEQTDDAVFERLGADWWARAMLGEYEWLATLIDQRMLQFKLVARSLGNEMTSWLPALQAMMDDNKDSWPNFRNLLEQFKKSGEVNFPAAKEATHV